MERHHVLFSEPMISQTCISRMFPKVMWNAGHGIIFPSGVSVHEETPALQGFFE